MENNIIIVGRGSCALKFYRNLKDRNYNVKIFDFCKEDDDFSDYVVISYVDIIPPLCKKYIFVKCGCSINVDSNFGIPELEIKEQINDKNEKIRRISVKKSCLCGATYEIIEEANKKNFLNFNISNEQELKNKLNEFAMLAEYFCVSNDYLCIHVAGEIHSNALKKAIKKQ